jgi:hypothetical protein
MAMKGDARAVTGCDGRNRLEVERSGHDGKEAAPGGDPRAANSGDDEGGSGEGRRREEPSAVPGIFFSQGGNDGAFILCSI